jgi:OOP family OmpA-OmpF porin
MRATPALIALLLVSSAAHADRAIEIGIAGGGHVFSSQVELGVDDDRMEPGPASNGLFGVRLAVPVLQRLAVEAESVVIPTYDDVLQDGATVFGIRAHARFDLLTGRIKPFLVAGLGMHVLRSSSPQMNNDIDRSYHWGGGVRYALNHNFDIRIDARHLIVPDRTLDGATSDFEVTAGLTYRFAKHARSAPVHVMVAAVPPPAPPPVPPAPVVEEPAVPENPDIDGDGIPNAKDTCPDDAETKNGFRDDDGCPDQVIEELTGINFELDSAKIDVASTPLLERAYEILHEYPGLSVEVSGHTSAEGNGDRNLTLSLARAEAVKTYLVRRGIPAERILTVGHGADVPRADNKTEEGRRKNRRIEFRILTPDELP